MSEGLGHSEIDCNSLKYKLCGKPPQYAPAPVTLTFDLLTLKVVSESRVKWATYVIILVFVGLSVLDLSLMYATDRQTSDGRQHHCIMLSPTGRGIIIYDMGLLLSLNVY